LVNNPFWASGGPETALPLPTVVTATAPFPLPGIPGPVLGCDRMHHRRCRDAAENRLGTVDPRLWRQRGSTDRTGIPVVWLRTSVFIFAGFWQVLRPSSSGAAPTRDSPTAALRCCLPLPPWSSAGPASPAAGDRCPGPSPARAGAVILGSITNGLRLLNVDPNWSPFAEGTVLVAAVVIDVVRQRTETPPGSILRAALRAPIGNVNPIPQLLRYWVTPGLSHRVPEHTFLTFALTISSGLLW
jgi:hypothetical protein